MSFKNIKSKIARMMDRNPHCKDDDRRLCCNIWAEELSKLTNGKDYKLSSSHAFLLAYAEGRLTSAPTIKRARAKLQEEYPEYRGDKYNLRQKQQQNKVKEELGYHWLPYKD
jgi:hypothetical protein